MRMTMRRIGALRGARGRVLTALPAATFAAALSLAAPAQAQTDNNDFFGNILGAIGLTDQEKPQIQYRERAPLVVPPGQAAATLPPPKESAVTTNPNWPKDPDVLRAEQARVDGGRPIMREDSGKPLLPSQLNNVRHRPTASAAADGPVGASTKRDVLLPSELGFKGWNGLGSIDDKPLTFAGEPTRESLTEPPPGYQTPAPNAPYGTVEKKQEAFKFPTLFDRN